MKDGRFWRITMPRVLSTYAIVIFALLWIGFAVALVVNRAWLDSAWDRLRSLPLIAEIGVWVLFLPITTGLWVWTSSWPALVRLIAAAGIAAWTIVAVTGFARAVRAR